MACERLCALITRPIVDSANDCQYEKNCESQRCKIAKKSVCAVRCTSAVSDIHPAKTAPISTPISLKLRPTCPEVASWRFTSWNCHTHILGVLRKLFSAYRPTVHRTLQGSNNGQHYVIHLSSPTVRTEQVMYYCNASGGKWQNSQ